MSWQTKIPKFRRFVIQNFPFIEQDFDALTDYQLICKVVKYLNKVIDSQNQVIDQVSTLTDAFNELQSFVDNYFDNLDVQDEINNKLDEMAEDGTLQEIIASYIQNNVTWTFDTVADMKNATNLVDGSYARTLGFYNVNDGGGATYYITDTGTANEMDVIEVGTLYANLQHNDTIFVKQLGAYGDGETNDTQYFNRAFEIADNIIVNKTNTSYLVTYFKVPAGKKIKGACLPYVQIDQQRGSSTEISTALDNTTIENIYLNSLDENLNNNRFDLRNSNITIKNSRFEGFRATTSNAWGLLLTGAKNVTIDNCYFKNNTQSDIAIVEGTENIVIKNCSGLSFHINLEPANTTQVKNVDISNCVIARLDVRENTNLTTACQDISVCNCTIDLLEYDGGKSIFSNCIIKAIQPQTGDPCGGEVKFINSINVIKPLIKDIYIDNFTPATSATTEWFVQSQPSALDACYSYDILNDNPVFTINTNYTQRTASIRHSDISVDSTKTYMIRINASIDYTQGASNISRNIVIRQYDSNDQQLTDIKPSMFRGASGTLVPMHEECCIFKVTENASKIRLIVRNADYGKQKFMVRSIELFEITGNEACSNMPDSPLLRNKRVFSGTTVSTGMNYKVGDTMYYEEPTSYIGKVCSSVTDYTATWTDFGALAA